jgi:hypothetical protein
MAGTTPRDGCCAARRGHHSCPASRLPHPAGLLPNRRVLAGYRRVDQHIADRDRRATSLGGLECLQAVPVAPSGDCHHGGRILVHRARLCAEAAVGRGGALLGLGAESQHFIASSRCRPERDHLDQAGMLGHGNSLPPAPEAAACAIQILAQRLFQSQTPRSAAGVRQLDRVRVGRYPVPCQQVCIRPIDAIGAPPGPRARVHRIRRGTSAPGDGGCMREGRQTQPPSRSHAQTITATATPSPNVAVGVTPHARDPPIWVVSVANWWSTNRTIWALLFGWTLRFLIREVTLG